MPWAGLFHLQTRSRGTRASPASPFSPGRARADAGRRLQQGARCCAASDLGSLGCTPTGLLDNLVGYWRLDDSAGSTVAFDSSGRGNQGALARPRYERRMGRRALAGSARDRAHRLGAGRALALHRLDLGPSDASAPGSTSKGSITSSDIFGTALSRQVGTSVDQHYHLSVSMDGRPTLFIATVSGYVSPQANPTSMRTWIHLAGVYDGTMVRFYVDGAEVASAALTGTFVPDTTPIILGGNGNDASGVPTELFPGRIDELMLYARALSAAEIRQLAAGVLFRT